MADFTPNYNLKKPLRTEYYDITDFNGNSDVLDNVIDGIEDRVVLAENDIGNAEGRLDLAEADIDALEQEDIAINAQLAEKVQNFKLTNEVVNGDFSSPDISNITVNAVSIGMAVVIENGKLKVSANNWTYASGATISFLNFHSDYSLNDKYYVCGKLKVNGNNTYVMRFGDYADAGKSILINASDYAETATFSGVIAPASSNFNIRHYLMSAEYVEILLDDLLSINLTKTFGAGNEPTKLEMDELMKVIPNGWWNGELSLTQKQYMTWLLNLQRKNTNAIIALGGTII